jgi:hypothetical protein
MKTTINMAREAGMAVIDDEYSLLPFLKRLVALARADEREACAKVCDAWQEWGADGALLAAAIRARGNTWHAMKLLLLGTPKQITWTLGSILEKMKSWSGQWN